MPNQKKTIVKTKSNGNRIESIPFNSIDQTNWLWDTLRYYVEIPELANEMKTELEIFEITWRRRTSSDIVGRNVKILKEWKSARGDVRQNGFQSPQDVRNLALSIWPSKSALNGEQTKGGIFKACRSEIRFPIANLNTVVEKGKCLKCNLHQLAIFGLYLQRSNALPSISFGRKAWPKPTSNLLPRSNMI